MVIIWQKKTNRTNGDDKAIMVMIVIGYHARDNEVMVMPKMGR
jgi:hypothetical protein